MDKLRIVGGQPLNGTIRISGAKNAALPLMTASLLSAEPLKLSNLPNLSDIATLTELMECLGTQVTLEHTAEGTIATLKTARIQSHVAPYDIVRKMRASFLVLGPLLARHGIAHVSLPGGCAIGARPVNLHLMGLEKMGAEIVIENGYVMASAPKGLQGADITFPVVSVTGTENLLMAACLANGTTRLINAACEPEVTDLCHCLIKMGAQIEGVGTSTLTITGQKHLTGAFHRILPDRIETGTYAMAVAATGGTLRLTHTSADLLPGVVDVLRQIGAEVTAFDDGLEVSAPVGQRRAITIETQPYPGYPTDLQAQLMAVMTVAEGTSYITETIWENRLMHVPELARMGADITLQNKTAIIKGVPLLKGAQVMATDLRASVSLVIAGLVAQGETWVNRLYHLDRGYENLEAKLQACGAHIERVQGQEEAYSEPQAI